MAAEKLSGLHDIKPLMPMHDYTLYFLTAAAIVVTVIIVLVVYLAVRRWQHARRENRRQKCFDALQRIDFGDSKAAAYAITGYGRCFESDSPRLQEAFHNLTERLEPYKYKKTVPPIDEETRSYYRIFLGMIDV